jgi:cation diffusion facilitator CzcD-associated flavoprotein CzcO
VVRVVVRNGIYVILLDNGDEITADHVVVAIGLKAFAWRPQEFAALPLELACHTSDLYDLSGFQGKRVAVIGSGQGALECAALLSEQNANVEVLARASGFRWRPYGGHARKPSGSLESYLRSAVFRRLPRFARDRWLRRTLQTAPDGELRPRLESVKVTLGCNVTAAFTEGDGVQIKLENGIARTFDRVVFGTGYRIDVNAIPFLAPELRRKIAHHDGYPKLNSTMESTVQRLYFAGAPAALNFGTHMWFVHGAPVAAEHISRVLRRRQWLWNSAVAREARSPVSHDRHADDLAD